jgi:hypothetical protein
MPVSSEKPLLDYAPRPRARTKRWFVHLAIFAIIVGVSLALWHWSDSIQHRVALGYWARQCAAYAPPPGQIVYDSGGGKLRADALLNSSPEYHEAPRIWSGRDVLEGIFLWVRPWTNLRSHLPPNRPELPDRTPIFMHDRTSANGSTRLVVVELGILPKLSTAVLSRGTFGASVVYTRYDYSLGELHPLYWGQSVPRGTQIFAGQADPTDASHFTVGFTLDGDAGMIDGWLENNETVLLRIRDVDGIKKRLQARWPAVNFHF